MPTWIYYFMTFGAGFVAGCIVVALGAILTMGARTEEVNQKMWRDVEAERKRLNAIERREVKCKD